MEEGWRSEEEREGGRYSTQKQQNRETISQHTARGWSILTTGEATPWAYLCHLACIQLGGVNWGRDCTVIATEGNLLWSGETLPTNTAHCGV